MDQYHSTLLKYLFYKTIDFLIIFSGLRLPFPIRSLLVFFSHIHLIFTKEKVTNSNRQVLLYRLRFLKVMLVPNASISTLQEKQHR
jgi:hypothetical protein